jgi:UDP-N-acetylmuramoylalanine--D-glutamate ligase
VSYAGRRVAVWGAARSGIAAANLLHELGAEVTLSDPRTEVELDLAELKPSVELVLGSNALQGADLLIPSPGIRPSVPALADARMSGVQIMSEIELAASVARAPIVAITGTDGKSTTTAMVGAVVEGAGRRAIVAGNIGDPFSRRVLDAGAEDVLVIEVSAFQLWSCGSFRPQLAIVTNIAEDHAEYFEHDTQAYIDAKARVLTDMEKGSTAILRYDDPIVRGFCVPVGVVTRWFEPAKRQRDWGLDGHSLTYDGRAVMAANELRVPGHHNVCNALSALAAGHALGLPMKAMVSGLMGFSGLAHRLAHVRVRRGVDWYNDSKATNPHAASAGLRALERRLIVITGGYEKELDLEPFVMALGRAKHVIVTGPTAQRTIDAMAGRWPVSKAMSMTDAVAQAAQIADYGDAVILSPAASSFDAYRSYAHRGEIFESAVRSLPD